MKYLNPADWPRPRGYSNGIEAEGKLVFVAGMIGWDAEGRLMDGFEKQFAQALSNVLAVLKEAHAGPEHIVRMTWFIRELNQYREHQKQIGAHYRTLMGQHYPAMSVVGVSELLETDALLEIEATAVIRSHSN